MKIKYKIIALLLGGLFVTTGCSDFLDRRSKDSVAEEDFFTTDAELYSYTADLYGGLTWNNYMQKFVWCANELMAGNVYHQFGDEGAFFFLSYNNTNTILEDGYKCLYNVISRANAVIIRENRFRENGISDEAIRTAMGEARMFRGMAYFLLAELWGETPIVTDNATIIAENKANDVPKATRGSLYAQIEKDWKEAAELLPAAKWGDGKVTKMSAYGMLAKLYVTMAACGTDYGGPGSYKCPDPAGYYQKALDMMNTDINGTTLLAYCQNNLESNYNSIFNIGNFSNESLFMLRFYNGPYGSGSPLQIQFGRSKVWNGGLDAYGGGKGLTVTLFNSFGPRDVRKKATSLYPEAGDYDLYGGGTYKYNINTSVFPVPPYGSEDRGYTLNGLKKYVYGYQPTGDRFSCPMNIHLLRAADILLLHAEAQMFLSGDNNVTNVTSDGVASINLVRNRAGLEDIQEVAFWTPSSQKNARDEDITYTAEGINVVLPPQTEYEVTYSLMTERRWEFTLEFQAWQDIKRLYYRDRERAVQFIKEQDRSFYYGARLGFEGNVNTKEAYQRQKYIHLISEQMDEVQEAEGTVFYDNLKWFLPLPKNVSAYQKMQMPAVDYVSQIEDGTYPY
jgi:hypothetical protein